MSDQDRVREFSKTLFGSAYRLEVAAAIARADPAVVNASDLVTALGLPPEKYGVVRLELQHFAKAGLLAPLPRPRGQRIQEYQRADSAYWNLSSSLMAESEAKSDRS